MDAIYGEKSFDLAYLRDAASRNLTENRRGRICFDVRYNSNTAEAKNVGGIYAAANFR